MKKHIVLIEDDPVVREIERLCLADAGYRVTALSNGSRVEAVFARGDVDLAIVDLGLPDADGLSLTRHIRERYGVGIIILSGRGETTDRIIGLEVGADDYLGKPFEPRELVARVRSLIRRLDELRVRHASPTYEPVPAAILSFLGWRLDLATQSLYSPEGETVRVTSGEFKLLEILVSRPNRVLTRDQLLSLASSNDSAAFDRSIDVRIGRLRKKLGDDSKDPRMIKTVRNGGYIFAVKVEVVVE